MGEVGKGYKIAIGTLNEGRIGIGAQMLGVGRAALEASVRYAKERVQFGRIIGTFQGVTYMLAACLTMRAACRGMIWYAG